MLMKVRCFLNIIFKGTHYHSFGTNTSHNVSILLSKNFTVNDNLTFNDDHGRITFLTVTYTPSKQDFTLIYVYAPNRSSDRINFLVSLNTKIPMKKIMPLLAVTLIATRIFNWLDPLH